jgi:site-specific DNA recombinase
MSMGEAVLYCRVSTERQASEGESLEAQRGQLLARAASMGLDVVPDGDADVFVDAGVSGKSLANRPAFARALGEASKPGRVLMVYSLSRMSRSLGDMLSVLGEIREAGGALVSLTEPIDTTTPMGEAFFQMVGVFNELQRKIIAQQTKDAMVFAQANGKRVSYHPPYGWSVDPDDSGRIIQDFGEQANIRRIAELRNEGLSTIAIADQMQEDKRLYRGKPKWHHENIRRILKRAGVD